MKKRRLLVAVILLVACGVYAARAELYRRYRGLPPYTHTLAPERAEMLPMRDGVRLHTTTYLPKGGRSFPTVLLRNPYAGRSVFALICQTLARYGYACVLQDIRGRNDSEGEWVPFDNEREDGLATLDWLRAQPFVDGNIALIGASYLGSAQWLIADALPPEVKTLVPQVFGTELYDPAYERGLFRPEVLTAWATLMPSREMRLFKWADYEAAIRHRPAIDADTLYMTRALPWYREWLENPNPGDALWQSKRALALREMPRKTRVPLLLIGGWFDPFLSAQFASWRDLATREQSVFLIGPYNHLGLIASGVQETDDAGGGLDQWPQVLDWLGHHLRGEPLRILQPGTLRVRGIATGAWQTLRRLEGGERRVLGLQAGDAQSCEGAPLGGPEAAMAVRFRYDPKEPNPTRGGAALLAFAFFRAVGAAPGPADQGESCLREDVLTWKSPPLLEALLLSGRAQLRLKAASSVDDTAFVARLIDEDERGQALLVREGAATLALPFAETRLPIAYTPGSERDIAIDFWPMRWQLQPGHRVRVDLSSSSFPALVAHSNFAGPWATQKETRVAEQTVLGGALDLPVETTP